MIIVLTGESGGIGTAIKDLLFNDHTFVTGLQDIDWLICAQGFIGEEDMERTFKANTLMCIKYTEAFLPTLRKGVIYISSTSGIRGNTKFPIYSASKAAINSYAETMARKHPELQFNAICPGPTKTKMWDKLNLEGNPQKPIEVAKVIKRIMDGEFKSGAIITVRNGIVT